MMESKGGNMDLEKQATVLSNDGKPRQVALFDAVREWTNAEGVGGIEVEFDGQRIAPEQLQEIAHSADYKAKLMAFFERRD